MTRPTASDVHVNVPLTQISIAYLQSQDMFIAGRVFPIIPVAKQSDRYFVYEKADWHRMDARLRAPSSESAGGGWRIDNTPTYFADVYAVHKDVDDQIRANADNPLDMDRDSTEWVTQQLLLRRERTWADNYFTAGVWDTDLLGVAAAPGAGEFLQWNDPLSTPIEDITNAAIDVAEATAFRPNRLVLSPRVFNALKNHPDVLERIKYTQRAVLTTDILAGLLDIEQVLVAWGVVNTSIEQAPDEPVNEFFLGNHALLVYAAPAPSILRPSGGYMFSWTGYLGAGPQGNRIKSFRMEHLESDRIEGSLAFDAKLVSADVGVFFEDAVA